MTLEKRQFTTRKIAGNLPVKQGDKYRPGDDILDKDYIEGSIFDVLAEVLDFPCILSGLTLTENVGADTLTFAAGKAILPFEPNIIPIHDYDGAFLNSISSPPFYRAVVLNESKVIPINFVGNPIYVTLLAGLKDEEQRQYVQNPIVSYYITLSSNVDLIFTTGAYYANGVPLGVISGITGSWVLTQDTGTNSYSDILNRPVRVKEGAAHKYAPLDGSDIIPSQYIPTEFREIKVVADIAARDALTPFEGLKAFVTDASADPTVNSGGAEYVWNGSAWIKTYEAESLDVSIDLKNTPDVKTSNYNAVAGERVLCNTALGGFTVTLPLSPNEGDRVGIMDVNTSFASTRKLVVGRNGENIININEDFELEVPKTSYTFVYINSYGWLILENSPNAYVGESTPTVTGLSFYSANINLTANTPAPFAIPGTMTATTSYIAAAYQGGAEVIIDKNPNTLTSITLEATVTGVYTITIFWF
jgi:hypothetical protein